MYAGWAKEDTPAIKSKEIRISNFFIIIGYSCYYVDFRVICKVTHLIVTSQVRESAAWDSSFS
jgi:hypothetical protein